MTSAFPHVFLCSRGVLTWNTPFLFLSASFLSSQGPSSWPRPRFSALSPLISTHAWCLHSPFQVAECLWNISTTTVCVDFPGGVFYDLANTARLCVSLLGCRDKLPHTEWLQTIDTYPLTLLSAGVWDQVSAGRVPLQALRSICSRSLSLPASGVASNWHSLACGHSTQVSASIFMRFSPPVSLCIPFFSLRTPVIGYPHPHPTPCSRTSSS